MKYIGNGFSPNMIADCATISVERITKDEFESELEDGYSIVGHPEIAEHYGVALNREQITLNAGDVLYMVSLCGRPLVGEIVDSGTVYEYEEDESYYCYHRIVVMVTATTI